MYDYDLFVIGAGSGGVRASRMSASYGARVAVCEDFRIGGTCVIRGCVPKKLLMYASHFAEEFADARGFGWSVGETAFSWPDLIAAKDREIDRLNGLYIQTLKNAGVEMIQGRGRLLGKNTVEVTGAEGVRKITAKYILVATGAWPQMPEIPGIEHAITSNEAFYLPQLPKRIVVVGGGYIAVEFASIFNGMGSQITELYRGEQILRGFDQDMRQMLAQEMIKKGIDIRLNINVTAIAKNISGLMLSLDDGSKLECDAIMYATGRVPNTAGLGLEAAGVKLCEFGAVVVDEYSQSSTPNIYAVGDVTDRVALTPIAIKEGAAFADTVFGGKPSRVDYDDIPSAVFSQPAVAVVGLSEADARKRYGEVDIYKSSFRPMKFTLGGREERSLMKLVVDKASDKVVGAHMVGGDAAEIIQGIAIAIKCGATKAQFDTTVAIHPSSAEEFVLMRQAVS
jgi:glutathione reductase (NADPH)